MTYASGSQAFRPADHFPSNDLICGKNGAGMNNTACKFRKSYCPNLKVDGDGAIRLILNINQEHKGLSSCSGNRSSSYNSCFLPREQVKSELGNKEGQHFIAPHYNSFGHSFRDYDNESERRAGVENFYKTNHLNQTYKFVKEKKEEFGKLNKVEMGIWECCELLNEFVDQSDPDLDEPQIQHLLQSAEAIRKDYPNQDWLHLTALVHDLGKVLLHPKFGAEPQWCVVGDTYPLGCAFDESIVYYKYFEENPDFKHPVYSTKLGEYTQNCGLENVVMAWGHDEYMYTVMKENKSTLPPAGLFIVRFHSFYSLHRNGAYSYLMNDEDEYNLMWLKIFNKYDLYSKSKVRVDVEKVKPYYLSLIRKYFPAKLRW
ncbi:inositol oxygenase 1-like [Diospyros lotus]|uniref:inositol oxygenase 1-like n=1 Tax=Diospyros lotus TaxID=55363 RepID=UPI00224E7D79|nr:inositol oxygenase 1-like [Diospyros lotus]